MSSAATRVLIRHAGAAWPWPALKRSALQASSPLVVVVGRSSRWGTSVRRGFGSSIRVLDKEAGGDKQQVDRAAEEKVLSEGEKKPSPPGEGESDGSGALLKVEEDKPVSAIASDQSRGDLPFAFAFDIDGVLLHKSDPIPGAIKTLKFLQQHDIPFILLTNGGGKPEAERVAELSAKLDVPLTTSQFVQSHTPFKRLVSDNPERRLQRNALPVAEFLSVENGIENLYHSTILVLGSDASKARRIALEYGFRSVVTPGDILKATPEIYPFDPLSEFYSKQEILPLPKPIYDPKNSSFELKDCLKIDLILVFNEPRDWAVDIQLVVDLLTSHQGYLGTYSPKNGKVDDNNPAKICWQNDGQPPLVFSNADLLWSTGYHLSRFGQGAFRAAVQGAFRAVTKSLGGRQSKMHTFIHFDCGKPTRATYTYASHTLAKLVRKKELAKSGKPDQDLEVSVMTNRQKDFRSIYMVGDNPESDIRGVNSFKYCKLGLPWHACLVKTGVWSEDKMPLHSLRDKPGSVHKDVLAAVSWALKKEGWPEKLE